MKFGTGLKIWVLDSIIFATKYLEEHIHDVAKLDSNRQVKYSKLVDG